MESKDVDALDQLSKTKGVKRSFIIREAVKSYLSMYTGEPDINAIEKRLREVESRLNELSAKIGGKTSGL